MPVTSAQVVSLHINPGHREPLRFVDRAEFVAGKGIEGDRHATDKPERRDFQVLLIDEETLRDVNVSPGDVRENVTTSGTASLSGPAGRAEDIEPGGAVLPNGRGPPRAAGRSGGPQGHARVSRAKRHRCGRRHRGPALGGHPADRSLGTGLTPLRYFTAGAARAPCGQLSISSLA